MLKQVFSLMRKELRVFFQRPAEFIVLLLTPLAFIFIFNLVFGGDDLPTVSLYAVNEDTGARGAEIIDRLRLSENLDVEVLPRRAEADRRVGNGESMVALVVPPGFTDATLTPAGGQLLFIVDPARSEQAAMVTGLVNAALAPIIADAEVTRNVRDGVASMAASEMFASVGASATTTTTDFLHSFLIAGLTGIMREQAQAAIINPQISVAAQPASASSSLTRPPTLLEYLTPGYSLFFAFFLVSTIAGSILTERNQGTFRRLLSLPTSRGAILLGKMLAYGLVIAAQMVFVFAASAFLFRLQLGQSPAALALMLAAIASAVVGMGIMMASLVRSEGQAGGFAALLTILMAAVGGALFPGIRVPIVEYASPHYWAIRGFQDIVARGQGVVDVLPEAGVLFGLAAAFFLIGARRLRFE